MLLPVLVAVAAAVSPAAGTYAGKTTERRPVTLEVRGGYVVGATAATETYTCDPHGELGGQTVSVKVRAKVRRGTFRFEAEQGTRRLKMTGTVLDRRTIRGRVRIHGTIGRGDPCTSRAVRFTVTRR